MPDGKTSNGRWCDSGERSVIVESPRRAYSVWTGPRTETRHSASLRPLLHTILRGALIVDGEETRDVEVGGIRGNAANSRRSARNWPTA